MALGIAVYLLEQPGQLLGTMYMREAQLNFADQSTLSRVHRAGGDFAGCLFRLDVRDFWRAV